MPLEWIGTNFIEEEQFVTEVMETYQYFVVQKNFCIRFNETRRVKYVHFVTMSYYYDNLRNKLFLLNNVRSYPF
jgi:hypothetical protein